MDGIENGGWKVVFNSDAPKMPGRRGQSAERVELYALGLLLADDGGVVDSVVGGLAFNAGISPGMKIVGVNGRLYTHDLLKDAVLASKDNSQPISLLVVHDEYYKRCVIEYHGGQRYPHLIRAEGKDDYLDELIRPRYGCD